MTRIKFIAITATLMCLSMQITPGICCVGRVLTIAVDHSADQNIMGHMLAVFINERTGTTVRLKEAEDIDACFKMVKDGNADMFLNYIGTPLPGNDSGAQGASPQETYSLVKQYYRDRFEMVWLKPCLYKGPLTAAGTIEEGKKGSLAAVVTTRKVLDRFPILDRVINKLSDRVDDAAMKQLMEQVAAGDVTEVVKDFLKQRNLI